MKFNALVLCNNNENRFTSYQWYKNGDAITGATKQFYNDPKGFSGIYALAVVTTDGKTLKLCGKYLNLMPSKVSEISVFPNRAIINDNFVIKINNLTTDDLVGTIM